MISVQNCIRTEKVLNALDLLGLPWFWLDHSRRLHMYGFDLNPKTKSPCPMSGKYKLYSRNIHLPMEPVPCIISTRTLALTSHILDFFSKSKRWVDRQVSCNVLVEHCCTNSTCVFLACAMVSPFLRVKTSAQSASTWKDAPRDEGLVRRWTLHEALRRRHLEEESTQ